MNRDCDGLASFDFDQAMRLYLGGDSDTGIQVGGGFERLEAVFGEESRAIQSRLDEVLAAIRQQAPNGSFPDGCSVEGWLRAQIPEVSAVCRSKIAAYVLYHALH